jgi:hypothetical protein
MGAVESPLLCVPYARLIPVDEGVGHRAGGAPGRHGDKQPPGASRGWLNRCLFLFASLSPSLATVLSRSLALSAVADAAAAATSTSVVPCIARTRAHSRRREAFLFRVLRGGVETCKGPGVTRAKMADPTPSCQ